MQGLQPIFQFIHNRFISTKTYYELVEESKLRRIHNKVAHVLIET